MRALPYPQLEPSLVRQCAHREFDPDPWWEFFERLRPRVRGVVQATLERSRRFPNRELVDDLEQEVYCRLLERDRAVLRQFRGESLGEAGEYLNRVARSVVLDFCDAEWAIKRTPRPIPVLTDREPTLHPSDPLALPAPERRCQEQEALRQFWCFCRRVVGPKDRKERLVVLRKVWLEGWTYSEVARASRGRWTRARVMSFVQRTQRKLRSLGVLLAPIGRREEKPTRAVRGSLKASRLG